MNVQLSPRRLRLLCLVALAASMSACGPGQPAGVDALNKVPGISNLMKERLRGDLLGNTVLPAPVTFPARVRIVPYDYQSGLQQVDLLTQIDGLADALKKYPDFVRDASVLPDAYGTSIGASFDGLMKLHEAVRADVFLLVSGRASQVEVKERRIWWPPDVLDRKAYWEFHSSLEALWVEAPSGRFLPSLQVATKAGPDLVVPDDRSTGSAAYALRRQVEVLAFRRLGDALITQLRAERAAQPTPSPTPKPTPTPSIPASAAASPEATGAPSTMPSPSPSASSAVNATPSPSPSTTATPAI